jgi:hypothetical protein
VAASIVGTLLRPVAVRLHEQDMRRLGIETTMNLAHSFNRLRYGRQERWRRSLFRNELAELLAENGPATRPPIEMRDGWALDMSMSLPFLDRVLEESDRIIGERAGVRTTAVGRYRSYFQNIWQPEDAEKYPSFLDFATSTDVLSVVSRALECIPALSTTLPPSIRLVESNAAFDDKPDRPHDSQLFHLDPYSLPNLYVLVLLRDTGPDNGPWTFLPKSVSQRIRRELGYWKRGKPYRLTDEEVYAHVDRSEVIEFVGPKGAVLFIESSGCMHYGSRNCVKPRFQLMYGYTGACRCDFSELLFPGIEYPVRDTDSKLRELVLRKNMLPNGAF